MAQSIIYLVFFYAILAIYNAKIALCRQYQSKKLCRTAGFLPPKSRCKAEPCHISELLNAFCWQNCPTEEILRAKSHRAPCL